MNFDAVIIGGGLAGLTLGIQLQKKSKRCVIVNNGQPAMDFSSGSLDLLSRLPSGEAVQHIESGLTALCAVDTQHPYAILGKEKVFEKAQQFLQEFDLGLCGELNQNHLRVTPLGAVIPTWLSAPSLPTLAFTDLNFSYTRITILGVEGYHDFQPQLLADNLKRQVQFAHCEFQTTFLHIPELDHLRENAQEFRSVHITQTLEHKLAFNALVAEIKQQSEGADAVFLPACFGLENQTFFNQLRNEVGLPLFELPTLPPSLLGIRLHKQLCHQFEKLGGLMLNGDRALRAEYEGNRVTKIFTEVKADDPLIAPHFILASGGFFSNGLVANFDGIVEPLFHSDILEQHQFKANDRLSWTEARFSSPQPYQSAGVVINAQCQVRKCGQFLENLFAVGNVIGGYNGIALGCGSGVAIVTALVVAEQIGS